MAAAAAAFFDLDKTIIAKSSVLAFGKFFYREGLLSRRAIVRSAYAQVVYMLVGADESKMEEVREAMLAITRGWNQEHVASIVRETLDEVVTPIIFAEAVELIDEHKAAGRKVVIVSSSPYEVVEPLATYLGADEAIATRAKIDSDGNYSGELSFYAYGPHKATAIRELAARDGIDLAESYAYSDSITDVPLLEAVGHPVAVNPDRELARYAREHDWEIRQFRRQVRLRDRMPMPPPAPTIAVSSIVVAAGAGAAAWWWWRRREGPSTNGGTNPPSTTERGRIIAKGTAEVVRDTIGAVGATRRVASAWRRG
jgi:HAD superfamily hydrolase (TIGR01490 family)